MRRHAPLFPVVAAQGEVGLQVVLHHPVERGVGGATRLVGGGDASLLSDPLRIRDGFEVLRL
jgi:hypothetical protein